MPRRQGEVTDLRPIHGPNDASAASDAALSPAPASAAVSFSSRPRLTPAPAEATSSVVAASSS